MAEIKINTAALEQQVIDTCKTLARTAFADERTAFQRDQGEAERIRDAARDEGQRLEADNAKLRAENDRERATLAGILARQREAEDKAAAAEARQREAEGKLVKIQAALHGAVAGG